MTDPGTETDSHDGISIRVSRRAARSVFWTTDVLSIDAEHPDGRTETNIDVSEVLEVAKYPADVWAARQGSSQPVSTKWLTAPC